MTPIYKICLNCQTLSTRAVHQEFNQVWQFLLRFYLEKGVEMTTYGGGGTEEKQYWIVSCNSLNFYSTADVLSLCQYCTFSWANDARWDQSGERCSPSKSKECQFQIVRNVSFCLCNPGRFTAIEKQAHDSFGKITAEFKSVSVE